MNTPVKRRVYDEYIKVDNEKDRLKASDRIGMA
jgi:hypothetical protein